MEWRKAVPTLGGSGNSDSWLCHKQNQQICMQRSPGANEESWMNATASQKCSHKAGLGLPNCTQGGKSSCEWLCVLREHFPAPSVLRWKDMRSPRTRPQLPGHTASTAPTTAPFRELSSLPEQDGKTENPCGTALPFPVLNVVLIE